LNSDEPASSNFSGAETEKSSFLGRRIVAGFLPTEDRKDREDRDDREDRSARSWRNWQELVRDELCRQAKEEEGPIEEEEGPIEEEGGPIEAEEGRIEEEELEEEAEEEGPIGGMISPGSSTSTEEPARLVIIPALEYELGLVIAPG